MVEQVLTAHLRATGRVLIISLAGYKHAKQVIQQVDAVRCPRLLRVSVQAVVRDDTICVLAFTCAIK